MEAVELALGAANEISVALKAAATASTGPCSACTYNYSGIKVKSVSTERIGRVVIVPLAYRIELHTERHHDVVL